MHKKGQRRKTTLSANRQRPISVAVRLNRQEHLKLKLKAEIEGTTVSQLVRNLVK